MSPDVRTIAIRDCQFGDDVVLVKPVNLYGCQIRSRVFVGPFVEIQPGVVVGERTRIQSHTFICEGVSLGSDCFVGHGVMFVNDLLRDGPARGDRSRWMPTTIGDRVSIGSNATLLPVRVCSDVVIGAGAVVTRDIQVPGIYAGNPAKRIDSVD